MRSFKELLPDNCEELVRFLVNNPDDDIDYAMEICNSLCDNIDEDMCRMAISYASGCLLVRVFDMGRYSFIYPLPLSETADINEAIDAVREYAVHEELPLCFTDTPREELGVLFSGFRHARVDTSEDDCDSFTVEIQNELMLLDEAPETVHGEISLSLLCDDDMQNYGALCRDEKINEFWGYKYSDDTDSPTDEYFYTEAIGEYKRSVSLPLAVRLGGILIGEAVFHAFDYRGGAEVGFRLAEKWQGKGFGKKILEASVGIAIRIGLRELRARVMKENTRSVALMSQFAEPIEQGGTVCYKFDLR